VTPAAFARTAHNYESVITEVPEKGPGGESVPAPGGLEEVNSMTAHSTDLFVSERIEGTGPAPARTDQWRLSPSKPGEYEFVAQLPLAVPKLGSGPSGVAFGSAGSEPEMYLAQAPFTATTGVHVFAAGSCGNLECATFQTFWTGAEVSEHGPFVGVGGIAVDHSTSLGDWASGDVFVDDGGNGVIDIFEPIAGGAEKYVGQVTGGGPVAVSGFNGDLIVGNQVFSPKEEAPKKGKYVSVCQLADPAGLLAPSSVAVDDSTTGTFAGEIYAITSGRVDEFGPECAFRGSIAGVPKEGTPRGVKGQSEEVPFGSLPSLAVDPTSHRVFVGQATAPFSLAPGVVDVFGPDVIVPNVATEAPSNLALETDLTTGAVSWGISPTGSVNPLNEPKASCGFAWGLTEAFGQEASCSGSVLTGGSPVSVHANLTKLEPDTDYFYRLHAKNEHGANPGEAAETYRFTTPGPFVRSETVSDVSSSSATFEATIAPHDEPNYAAKLEGSERAQDLQAPAKTPTSYFFQYNTTGTAACTAKPGACTGVPSSPVSVSSAAGDVNASQHATGLAANTTYHYRLVAMHEALPVTRPGVLTAFYGADRTFTTQGLNGPLVLADARAWELVSPADLHGAQLELTPQGRAAAGGGGLTFLTNGPTEDATPGNPTNGVQVLSTRTAPGVWSSVDIALSRSHPEGVFIETGLTPEFRWFSEDLGSAVAVYKAAFSVPEGWHQNELGEWEHIVESSPVPTEETPYVRHNTTCESAPSSCYEPLLDTEDVTSGLKYGGKAGVAGLSHGGGAGLPSETPDGRHLIIESSVQLTRTKAPEGGLYEWSAEKPPAARLSLVSVAPGGEPLDVTRLLVALSADGSRVFFTAAGASYMRDTVTETTVPLPGLAAASSDGSRVLANGEVYEVNDGGTSGIASHSMLAKIAGGGFALVGASRDLSSVYFIDTGVLPGQNAEGREPQAGADNLYVSRYDGETREWTTSFIASPPQGVGSGRQISPDGRWLAFESETSLTGYDNNGPRCIPIYIGGTKQVIGYRFGPCQEVYLYDAQAGRLACASCNPSGGRPVGHSSFIGGGSVTGAGRALFDPGRLFFNSGDALVPQDINGNTDVYEFEPPGVGGCTPASATFNTATGGCVALISSGVASGPSEFLDASATGADVFFSTGERLVPRDVDNLIAVYDAHECTAASPCPASSILPPPCTTEASCIASPSPQPSIFGPPSSATFSGPGNLTPEVVVVVVKKVTKKAVKCKKNFVKHKKGKCVRQKSKKRAKRASHNRRPSR
jgi:hypothetical protein